MKTLEDFRTHLQEYDSMQNEDITQEDFDTCIDNWREAGFDDPTEHWGAFLDWCAENWDYKVIKKKIIIERCDKNGNIITGYREELEVDNYDIDTPIVDFFRFHEAADYASVQADIFEIPSIFSRQRVMMGI